MQADYGDLEDEPCLTPPFRVLDYGRLATIVDGEGRELMTEYSCKGFVREMCSVLNENSERLVEAWKRENGKIRPKRRRRM